MALTGSISGVLEINQGGQTTLAMTVRDDMNQIITSGLTYSWSATRGSFVGATDAASAVYRADFTDPNAVDVGVTCDVTLPASVSASSLTAMTALGITGQLVNMHITDSNAVVANTNNILVVEGSDGTIEAGSDLDLTTDIHIYRVRWDNRNNNARLILNNNGAGSLNTYFSGNTTQSLYLIFGDGTYIEIDNAQYNAGSATFARWELTDQATIDRLNAWDGTENLLVGVADAGSISDETGSADVTVRATVVPPSIAMVSKQLILVETAYCLTVAITGGPEKVEVKGDMDYFSYDWRPDDNEVKIMGTPELLLSGAEWEIVATYSSGDPLKRTVEYDVVPALPVFGTLPAIHFYRGLPTNLDVPIQNPSAEIRGNAHLIGLGLTPTEEGANIDGEIPDNANFTIDAGDIELTIPHPGGDVMHTVPYDIEAGSPPQISGVTHVPYGSFAEVDVPDVTHAIEYEWSRDQEIWTPFRSDRQTINPRTVEIVPGNLQATVKFPVISGATAYQYRIVTATMEGQWTDAEATIANNMVSVIIPGLEDGVVHTVYFRVSQPWGGPGIPVQIVGGRLSFVMHEDGSNSYLYIFHTGVENNGTATRLKRLLLPTTFTGPNRGGIAVDGDDVYIVNVESSAEKALYKFDWTTFSDGDRVNNARRNPFGSGISFSAACRGLGIRGDELYILIANSATQPWDSAVHVIDKDQTDGATLTPSRSTSNLPASYSGSGASLSDDTLFVFDSSADLDFYPAAFDDGDNIAVSQQVDIPGVSTSNLRGHAVIGEAEQVYVVTTGNLLRRFEIDGTNYTQVWSAHLPTGLTDPYRVDILR